MKTDQITMNNEAIEQLVLSTLSFYEAMTFAQLIFDFDANEIRRFPHLEKDELLIILNSMEKKKKIKKTKINNEDAWIKLFPKRTWWKRIFV